MRLFEIEENKNIWYHGSGMDFETFNLDAKTSNRGTNPAGIYLTKDEDEARQYASYALKRTGKGIVYECEIDVINVFYEDRTPVSQEMLDEYTRQLITSTAYNKDWVVNAITPKYAETGQMKADLPGEIKTAVMKAGGYDAFFFNDMGGYVVVVFDPQDVTILNKFQPQELVKDPEYDDPIKQPEKEPEPEKPKKEKKPRPGDDDALGQLLHDFDL